MPTQRSIEEVEELSDLIAKSTVIIATSLGKLNTPTVDQLRRRLRATGNQYRVVKNTLVRIAADRAGKPEVKEIISGPCAFVLGGGDPVETARVFTDHVRTNRLEMEILGATLNGRVLPASKIGELAALPPRNVIVAQLLGQLNSPAVRLVTVLNGPVRGLANVLQRYVEKQQQGATAAA
jgi:large subunit ribosomal protein L10